MKPRYVDAKFYLAAFLFLQFSENLGLKPRLRMSGFCMLKYLRRVFPRK